MQNHARELTRSGHDIIHLDRGELEFETPELVVEAAIRALRGHQTRYTHSAGLPELREAICAHYHRVYGVDIDPGQVLIHAGSSPLLLNLLLAVIQPRDEVLIPDPGYPAYATCVRAVGGVPRGVTNGSGPAHFTAREAATSITKATKAIIVNSPCNPTGKVLDAVELEEFSRLAPLLIADETYHGLCLQSQRPHSMLEFSKNVGVLNSFSKAFAMTGWRLGYLIAPAELLPLLDPLQRDAVLSPNAFVQQAGITALTETKEITAGWRDALRSRRDTLVTGLSMLGMHVSCHPGGGFFAFARLPDGHRDAAEFTVRLLEEQSVAVVPGTSFGAAGEGHIRCSFTPNPERIGQAIERMATLLRG